MFQGGPRQDDELKLSDLTPKPVNVLVHNVFPAGVCSNLLEFRQVAPTAPKKENVKRKRGRILC
jgi:hypothetical protein